METYEKEADAIIKKSVLHKNDLIPDTYMYKLKNTLDCLPEKETTGQIAQDIKIIRNKGRMEIRAVASVAAAVMFICVSSALLLRKPDHIKTNSDPVTDVTTSISEPSVTTSVQVTSTCKITSVSTVAETTTEETVSEEQETECSEVLEVFIPYDAPPEPEKIDIQEPKKDVALPEKPKGKAEKSVKPEVRGAEEKNNTDVKQPKAVENPHPEVPKKPGK